MTTKKLKSRSGQAMVELILTLSVALVIVTTIVAVVTVSLRNAYFARQQVVATHFAQEGLEWVRAQKESGWSTISDKSGTSLQRYCISNLSWPSTVLPCPAYGSPQYITNTKFTRDLELINKDFIPSISGNETIEATVTVSWTDSLGSHKSKLTTQFAQWQ